MSLFTSCERVWPPRLCTCGYSLVLVLTYWIESFNYNFAQSLPSPREKNVTCNTDWRLCLQVLTVQWVVEVFLIWSLWCIKVVVKTQHSWPAISCLSHDISHDGLPSCLHFRLAQCVVLVFKFRFPELHVQSSLGLQLQQHFNCKLFWSKNTNYRFSMLGLKKKTR